MLTEGFDAPATKLVVLARPTTSGVALAQMVGRGTRLDKDTNKTEVIIIEIADSRIRYRTLGVGALFDLAPDFNAQGASLTDVQDALHAVQHVFKEHTLPLNRITETRQVIDLAKRAAEHVKDHPLPHTPETETARLADALEDVTMILRPDELIARSTRTSRAHASRPPAPHVADPVCGPTLDAAEFEASLIASDLLARLAPPPTVDNTIYLWSQISASDAIFNYQDGRRLEIHQNLLGHFELTAYTPHTDNLLHEDAKLLTSHPEWDRVVEQAEEHIRTSIPAQERNYYVRNAPWRNKPATELQCGYLRSLGIDGTSMTRGEASRAIDGATQQRSARQSQHRSA